jgi:3-dehydroquinate synthase
MTKVYVGRGLLQKIPIDFPGKIVVVADFSVKELYGDAICAQLNGLLFAVPPIKSKETWESIHEKLFQEGCGRDTLLVALGGGVICDVVGFAAATFMRGIPLVLIPTTLLAIVDAAIGGKTAIDTPLGKNLIGSLYHPKAVIADLDTLKTLPKEEWIQGLAEILKIGLVFNPSIWDLAQKDLENEELIYQAVQGKMDVVARDPTELGLRRILNFGHTIGHGLEKIGNMPHGKAVALGCLAESFLSMQLGYLSSQDFEKIQVPYRNFSLKLPKNYSREKLFQMMQHDKKKENGKIRFVLIDKIGSAVPFEGAYCRPVAEKELQETLQWLEDFYG